MVWPQWYNFTYQLEIQKSQWFDSHFLLPTILTDCTYLVDENIKHSETAKY